MRGAPHLVWLAVEPLDAQPDMLHLVWPLLGKHSRDPVTEDHVLPGGGLGGLRRLDQAWPEATDIDDGRGGRGTGFGRSQIFLRQHVTRQSLSVRVGARAGEGGAAARGRRGRERGSGRARALSLLKLVLTGCTCSWKAAACISSSVSFAIRMAFETPALEALAALSASQSASAAATSWSAATLVVDAVVAIAAGVGASVVASIARTAWVATADSAAAAAAAEAAEARSSPATPMRSVWFFPVWWKEV